jgi:hypothetical protein
LSVRSDNLDSVNELYTEDNFRQLVVAIEATPAFSAALASLKIMASAVCRERSVGANCAVARRHDDLHPAGSGGRFR